MRKYGKGRGGGKEKWKVYRWRRKEGRDGRWRERDRRWRGEGKGREGDGR